MEKRKEKRMENYISTGVRKGVQELGFCYPDMYIKMIKRPPQNIVYLAPQLSVFSMVGGIALEVMVAAAAAATTAGEEQGVGQIVKG